nr:PQQ-dependent dehydrogenase, methanol/ethanol family [Xanthomonadales bacterium]NIP12156.1 PQQ-dependent dehydrogenase, methanol/ethanol family [Xanthomonadales bacterium]
MIWKRTHTLALLGLLMGCAENGPDRPNTPRTTDTARIAAAEDEPDQWLSHGGTYAEQRFSRLGQINEGNLDQLKLAWYFDFDT